MTESSLQGIRKVSSIEVGYNHLSEYFATKLVNTLLERGWVLLNLRTVNHGSPGEPDMHAIYILGTDNVKEDRDAIEKDLREKENQEFLSR